MRYLLLLLVLLNGCFYCRVDTVQGIPIEEFRNDVFTREAAVALRDVEVYVGPLGLSKPSAGFAAGSSAWSYIPEIILLGKVRRAIIFENLPTRELLLHEYIHHLDDMTRDGEANFISVAEFKLIYAQHPYLQYLLRRSDTWVTDVFGIGEHSEHIASLGEKVKNVKAWSGMSHVYRKIFKGLK